MGYDIDDDEDHPDFEGWQEQRANRAAKLIFMVQMFSKNVGSIEEGVVQLYDLIDDDEEVSLAIEGLIELADGLSTALMSVDAAILGLIGYDEPEPEGDVGLEDFEQSVLTDLAQLDSISQDMLFDARKQHFKDELLRRGFGYE